MFHLLLCVTETIKQFQVVRGGRFRIEFQPGQGNLNHTHGDRLRSRPRYFSPFFPTYGSGTPPPPTIESDHSAPVRPDKNKPTTTKGVRDHSTHWPNQVLKLTDYHISRYVASTFKRLTKWATHHDLSKFVTTPAGYHNYTTPSVVLIFQQEFKVSQFLYARERQETTRLLLFLISRATSR